MAKDLDEAVEAFGTSRMRPAIFGWCTEPGAKAVSQHPVNALLDGLGLSITLLSCEDRLDFGLTADRELLPDVWHLADEMADELRTLAAELGVN